MNRRDFISTSAASLIAFPTICRVIDAPFEDSVRRSRGALQVSFVCDKPRKLVFEFNTRKLPAVFTIGRFKYDATVDIWDAPHTPRYSTTAWVAGRELVDIEFGLSETDVRFLGNELSRGDRRGRGSKRLRISGNNEYILQRPLVCPTGDIDVIDGIATLRVQCRGTIVSDYSAC